MLAANYQLSTRNIPVMNCMIQKQELGVGADFSVIIFSASPWKHRTPSNITDVAVLRVQDIRMETELYQKFHYPTHSFSLERLCI